jgi:hypothetical protein
MALSRLEPAAFSPDGCVGQAKSGRPTQVGSPMKQGPGGWYRYAGLGVEFAASFGAFVAVGWWIGRRTGTNPWAALVGAALGFIGAMVNLIRAGLQMARNESAGSEDQRSGTRAGHREDQGPV